MSGLPESLSSWRIGAVSGRSKVSSRRRSTTESRVYAWPGMVKAKALIRSGPRVAEARSSFVWGSVLRITSAQTMRPQRRRKPWRATLGAYDHFLFTLRGRASCSAVGLALQYAARGNLKNIVRSRRERSRLRRLRVVDHRIVRQSRRNGGLVRRPIADAPPVIRTAAR